MKENQFKNKIDKIVKNIFEENGGSTTDNQRLIIAMQKYSSIFKPLAAKIDSAVELEKFITEFYETFFNKESLTASEFQQGLRNAAAKYGNSSKEAPSMELPALGGKSTMEESFNKMKEKLKIRD